MQLPRLLALLALAAPLAAQSHDPFESPTARAIAISSDAQRLYVTHPADHVLAVFSLAQPEQPVLLREIQVGLDPVSVAVHRQDEVWVVNHASDSISIVDTRRGYVKATLQMPDEPGDIVFAGSPRSAFVSSMTTRQVLVFDPLSLRQVASIPVFADDPRALLASADGKRVWILSQRSGNGTTVVPHTIAPAPPPPTNTTLPAAPKQGILVRADDPAWKARLGVDLPDHDVFEVDALARRVVRRYQGVGTSLFHMAQRPGTAELWVANTEARNLVRFEPALRGHVIDSRVTRIVTGGSPSVVPIDLNPGIDYRTLPNASALATALSQPTDLAFSKDGLEIYLAAFGTDRIGVLDTQGRVQARIEIGDSAGVKVAPRTKRGPRALLVHPSRPLLYVYNRLSSSLSIVDTAKRSVLRELPLFDPTPKVVREGRGFFFDAKLSGNGSASCAACHIDARTDGLAWDLGDPGGRLFDNGASKLHPMKGPLLTQTMQGLGSERIFHWRADRPGLASFNATFRDLLGGQALAAADIGDMVTYQSRIRFMSNPQRTLDDRLPSGPTGESASDGERIFRTKVGTARDRQTPMRCIDCHSNPRGAGSFGFDGLIDQPMKAAQLRGLYKRDGRLRSPVGRSAGFGYGADGSKDSLQDFVSTSSRFNAMAAAEKRALERFLLAFPTETAPAVGAQRTVTAKTLSSLAAELLVLVAQAELGNCDLVVHGVLAAQNVAFVYDRTKRRFVPNTRRLGELDLVQLASQLGAGGSVLSFLGVPPGSGVQIGIDRDLDGLLDGDERGSAFGSASPGCAPPLALLPNSEPRVGTEGFALSLLGGTSAARGWLLLGASRASLDLFDLRILVDPTSALLLPLVADGRGDALLPLALPPDPGLVGTRLSLQGLLSSSCGQLGLSASPGLELRLTR